MKTAKSLRKSSGAASTFVLVLEPGRSRDEARRIAANVAKRPETIVVKDAGRQKAGGSLL
jgi:hypothetical protein